MKSIGYTGLAYLWNKIKNLLATGLSAKADKATTLAGYGITDAVTLNTTQTITGNKKFSYSKLEIDGGEYKFNFHIERRFSGLTNNGNYSTWDSEKKDGTWHRIWRVSFPEGSNFWGKLTIGFVGSYSSFNASGYIEKEICVAFNGSSLFNNVGRYSALGLNVEKDFRISELIWNSDTNQWQILIYSHLPSGNNCPKDVILKCETSNSTTYSTTFEGITISNAEVSQIASYVNTRATVDGTSKTFYFADLPVYQDPYGEEIAVISDIPTKVSQLSNDSGFLIPQDISGKLDKTTFEWNKELSNGSNGKVCLGKFFMYDGNVTIDLSFTTIETFNATIVIASQNLNRTTSTGVIRANVYGDVNNSISPLLSIFRPNPSTENGSVEVYANLPGFSKCLVHIQGVRLETKTEGGVQYVGGYDILSNVSAIPTEISGKTLLTNDGTVENNKVCNLLKASYYSKVYNGTSSQFLKADGSVDSNTYLTSHQDISGKADNSTVSALATRVTALEGRINIGYTLVNS